jgi:hypothetical protein
VIEQERKDEKEAENGENQNEPLLRKHSRTEVGPSKRFGLEPAPCNSSVEGFKKINYFDDDNDDDDIDNNGGGGDDFGDESGGRRFRELELGGFGTAANELDPVDLSALGSLDEVIRVAWDRMHEYMRLHGNQRAKVFVLQISNIRVLIWP